MKLNVKYKNMWRVKDHFALVTARETSLGLWGTSRHTK